MLGVTVTPRRTQRVWKLHENSWHTGCGFEGGRGERWRWLSIGVVSAVVGSVDRTGILGSSFPVFLVGVGPHLCWVVRVAGRWVASDPEAGSFELRNCAIPPLRERGTFPPLPS